MKALTQLQFPDLKSIHVRVEERRSGATGGGNWRTHEYSGFETLPPRLRPSFGGAGAEAELDLLERVWKVYEAGRTQARFADSYGESGAQAVQREVTIEMCYHQQRRDRDGAGQSGLVWSN